MDLENVYKYPHTIYFMGGYTSIGKADGEGVISLGSQAWNIADGFTKIKILRLLIELDLYETIAMFGRKDLEEQIPESEISYRRYEAIQRVLFNLKQLIGNCNFAVNKGEDAKLFEEYLKRIDHIEDVFDGIADYLTNDVTKETELRINEDHFKKCFDILRTIKDELNFPINRAGLIFKASDTLDLEEIMRDIENGA